MFNGKVMIIYLIVGLINIPSINESVVFVNRMNLFEEVKFNIN